MSVPSLSLEGKVALVTGGRWGIGRAVALAFAGAGADVAVCDAIIADGELAKTAEECRKLGRRSIGVQVDVTKKVDVDNFVKQAETELGPTDILVNCAGLGGGRT